jgi:hypothetical protein
MRFDVSIAHEASCTRIVVIGEPTLGRLLSLLQVLQIDSASWPREAVLMDMRGMQTRLGCEEQSALAADAARALRRMKRIAVVAPAVPAHEQDGVQFFEDAQAAVHWLAQG